MLRRGEGEGRNWIHKHMCVCGADYTFTSQFFIRFFATFLARRGAGPNLAASMASFGSLGTVTVNTPFTVEALMFATSADLGRMYLFSKLPWKSVGNQRNKHTLYISFAFTKKIKKTKYNKVEE